VHDTGGQSVAEKGPDLHSGQNAGEAGSTAQEGHSGPLDQSELRAIHVQSDEFRAAMDPGPLGETIGGKRKNDGIADAESPDTDEQIHQSVVRSDAEDGSRESVQEVFRCVREAKLDLQAEQDTTSGGTIHRSRPVSRRSIASRSRRRAAQPNN